MINTSTRKRWMKNVSEFFQNVNWTNTLTFLVFLILSAIFWLMLFFQRDVEASYKIPLKYVNVPHDVVFDYALPKDIEIRVGDKGSEIFRYTFFLKDTIEIDVAHYQQERIENLQGTELTQILRTKLFKSSNLRAYYPAHISLATSKLEKKELRVVFDGEITTGRNNLIADTIEFQPETILAYGSRNQLAELSEAVTEYTQFSNLKASSLLNIKIKPIQGIKFVPNQVDAYISITEFTEQKFEIPIKVINAPPNIDVKFFPSHTEVSFSVTLEAYKKIIPEDFVIELDFTKFHENENGRVVLKLSQNPDEAHNIKLSPTSVEFLLEKK